MEFESAGLGLGTTVRISLPLFSSFTCRMTKSSKSDVCQRLALPAFNHDRSPSVSSVASLDDMPYQVGVTNAAPTPVHPGVRKILIVDDVMLTLKIVSKILTRAGFQCMEANNGSECIEIVRKHNDIDLILMDSEMPVMNGPEAAHILVHGQHCTIPIIGLSGNVLKSDIDYFKGCGAIDVLAKPLQLNELWVHIEKINLDRQQKSNSQRMLNSVAEEAEDGDIKFDLVL